jgi:hypothetical protein
MHLTEHEGKRGELERLTAKHQSLVPDRRLFGKATFDRWAVADDRLAGRRLRAAASYVGLGIRQRSPRDLLHAAALLTGDSMTARLRRLGKPNIPAPSWLTRGFHGSVEALAGRASRGSVH